MMLHTRHFFDSTRTWVSVINIESKAAGSSEAGKEGPAHLRAATKRSPDAIWFLQEAWRIPIVDVKAALNKRMLTIRF